MAALRAGLFRSLQVVVLQRFFTGAVGGAVGGAFAGATLGTGASQGAVIAIGVTGGLLSETTSQTIVNVAENGADIENYEYSGRRLQSPGYWSPWKQWVGRLLMNWQEMY